MYTTENLTKQSGYVSLKFANFTFEQLKKYSVNGYRIIINEERKLKFESELETCTFGEDITIKTHPDVPVLPTDDEVTLPADSFLKTDAEKALYFELLKLLLAVVIELCSVDDIHGTRVKQMYVCGHIWSIFHSRRLY